MILLLHFVAITAFTSFSCDAFCSSISATALGSRFSSGDRGDADRDGAFEVPLDSRSPASATGIDNDDDNEINLTFSATPITVTTAAITSSNSDNPPGEHKINSATLRFNNRLNQLAKNWDESTAPKVEAMLLDALDKYQLYLKKEEEEERDRSSPSNRRNKKKKNDTIIPNTISFTNAITAWARCTRKDSARHAQSLLDRMLHLYIHKNWIHVKPNKITYNSVITAWARSNDRGSARKAEELLRSMYEFYNNQSGCDVECKPDSRSFNAVINAVARSREKNCADRAKFLLDEMGRLYNEGDTDLLPDALTFGAIINAYANSMEAGASDKAAQLLMHMESLYQLGFENAKPTTFVYNACMNAFAKDPLICVTGDDNQKNRAEKAEQLLDSMEKRYNEQKDWRIKPDIISYSTVINAHANSGTPNSGVSADAILRRMMYRYLLGDTKCRPNAIVFTAAIKAHSSAINATLSELDESNEGDDDDDDGAGNNKRENQKQEKIKASAKRCEDLLQQLCLLYQLPGNDRSLKPTSVTFELVTGALSLAKDWEGVERIKVLREVTT